MCASMKRLAVAARVRIRGGSGLSSSSSSSHAGCVRAVSSRAASRASRSREEEEAAIAAAFEGASCPGCGVVMQSRDASLPGFFRVPEALVQRREREEQRLMDEQDGRTAARYDYNSEDIKVSLSTSTSALASSGDTETTDVFFAKKEEDEEVLPDIDARGRTNGDYKDAAAAADDDDDAGVETRAGRRRRRRRELRMRLRPSAHVSAGAGGGDNVFDDDGGEENRDDGRGLQVMDHETAIVDGMELEEEEEEVSDVVCARCFSLVNYGRIKSVDAETLLPSFDVDAMVARVLQSPNTRKRLRPPVFVVVVDMMDFDGSLLRGAMRLVQEFNDIGRARDPGAGLILCVNKIDLLPASMGENKLREWIYARLAALGLRRPHKTCVVSAALGAGITNLLSQLEKLTSVHSDVYLIGSQNAGKSSLINAMAAATGGRTAVTVAEMPGTTITPVMLDTSAILIPNRQQVRIFDTPGALHPHSVTSRLGLEENKDLLGRGRRFEPRTFRIGAGNSVLASSLLQVDVVECSAATLYITLWVSPAVSAFMGKTPRADVHRVNEAGKLLVPSLAPPRDGEDEGPSSSSPRFVKTRIRVRGDDWHQSSEDVAIAGLGWIAIGVNGTATLDIGTHEGVGVTRRAPLATEYATAFNKPGFDRRASNRKGGKKKKR